jgi:ATP-binding cassette subfamily B protein
LGTVVLFFFAFQRAYGVVSDLFSSMARLVSDQTFLKDFNWFMQIDTVVEKLDFATTDVFSLRKSIVCRNLSFKYETSLRNALDNVNFEIRAGSKVAFVGPNGSGKTTLVKMLCGFYQPNNGAIFFDGKNIAEIGEEHLRANITAVFQDFALYYLSVNDNISLGNKARPFDAAKVVEAAKAANVDQLIAGLPQAYESILGNQFENGEELSIGQWQKMAIARAFYRNTDLVIMDEPSSALDADAELQITESLKHLSHNKTAIVVSHRLSTIRWVDKIFYMDKGRVIESGTHDELLLAKGAYFELWNKSIQTHDAAQ